MFIYPAKHLFPIYYKLHLNPLFFPVVMKQCNILAVDDNKSVLSALDLLLSSRCKKFKALHSPNQLLYELQNHTYHLVLLDMNFTAGINTGNEGLYWLQRILEFDADMGVVMITAYGDIELAVQAVRLGALDFIPKPWDNNKLLNTIESACKLSVTRKTASANSSGKSYLPSEAPQPTFHTDCPSAAWQRIMEVIKKVAVTDANVLITGENGTGKELIAREIHRLSARSNKVMVSVDMGAISETLFESELFGHKKGAFTDAQADRTGKIEAANQGTLFLDEIGNLSAAMQAKLLTVLQNRTVTRLGENTPMPVDVRLICATNCNLQGMVANGSFREDLLYRINTIQIEIPSLRNRLEDIPVLATFFLEKYKSRYEKQSLRLAEDVMARLQTHTWPGNIRELQHSIEKAVILCDGNVIRANDFIFHKETPTMTFGDAGGTLEDMERKLIADAIERHSGNYTMVATQLGITRQTLYNKIKRYGL